MLYEVITSELFREVAAKVADRPGGYTRILKTGNRLGDNAEMCIIELVDFNEAMMAAKEEAAKPKKRRSRRGGSTKAEAPAAKAAPAVETKVVEEVKTKEAPEAVAETEVKAEETTEEPKAEDSADEEKKED